MNIAKMVCWLILTGFVFAAGCGQKSDQNDLLTTQNNGPQVKAVMGTGQILGKAVFKGKPPAPVYFSMDADPYCHSQHPGKVQDPSVLINAKGDIQNVLVYVQDGAGVYPAPTSVVVLAQKGCMYDPHVFGIQVGQPLDIVNDDATLHNIHCMAVTNASFNVGQPVQGMKTREVFTKPEIPIAFKCDVHEWMHCYCGVFTNPFYAVTNKDGSFDIKGLPTGTYTLMAWHEKFGYSAPQTVTMKDGEVKTVHFIFTSNN